MANEKSTATKPEAKVTEKPKTTTPVKAEEKITEKKAEKASVKTTKTPAEKTKTAVKTTKTPAKKTVVKTSATFEFGDKQIKVDDLIKTATKEYRKSHKGVVVKSVDVYVVAEEQAAYYVVNGEGSDDFKIDL